MLLTWNKASQYLIVIIDLREQIHHDGHDEFAHDHEIWTTNWHDHEMFEIFV